MNDHTLDASVVVDLEGNLERNAKRYEGAMQTMSRNGSRHMSMLQRTTAAVDRTMNRLGNRWVALATGGTIVAAGRNVLRIEERFERLGIQANRSTKDMSLLKREIFETANAAKIRVNAGELTGAVEEIVEKTGDLEFARNNLENLAMTIGATAAEGKAIGGIAAEFQKMGIINPSDVREALDILITQGKEGAFTLQNLAALGPRVVTAYTSMGRTGIPAIRELGAALQVVRMATGNSEQAATSFEALMRVLSDADKVKALQSGGIQVFEPEQLKQGKEVLRPVNQLITEIVKRTQGKKTILSSVLGDAEALRAFNQAITEFNASGEIKSLEHFYSLQADGANLLNDSARAAQTAAGSTRMLANAWEQFADRELAGPISDLADALKDLKGSEILEYLAEVKDVAIAVGGVLVGYKALKLGNSVRGLAKGASGNTLESAGGLQPIPVFVVNQTGGMSGTAGAPGSSGGKPGKGPGKLARLGGMAAIGAGGVLNVAGAGLMGYQLGSILNSAIEGTGFHDWVGATVARTLAAFGNVDAQEHVLRMGHAGPLRKGLYESNVAERDAVRVELDLTREAAKALKPSKADASSHIDVAVNGSVGAS